MHVRENLIIYVAVSQGDRLTVKRGSDGSCACKGNCIAKNCGCRKVLKSCGSYCKCVKEKCRNREDSELRNVRILFNFCLTKETF